MIKVFVGDPYLCMKALAPLICDIDSYSYRESTQFTDSEVMFLCGMPLLPPRAGMRYRVFIAANVFVNQAGLYRR